MKKLLLLVIATMAALASDAKSLGTPEDEDGSRLWMRYEEAIEGKVQRVLDSTIDDDEGYVIEGNVVRARTERGLLYGTFALLRGEQGA